MLHNAYVTSRAQSEGRAYGCVHFARVLKESYKTVRSKKITRMGRFAANLPILGITPRSMTGALTKHMSTEVADTGRPHPYATLQHQLPFLSATPRTHMRIAARQ